MLRQPWSHFEASQQSAHLVVGAMPSEPAVGPHFRVAQATLLRFLRQQNPTGGYATTIVREAGVSLMLFAFENAADARLFAEAIQGKTTSAHGGWASECTADLDGAILESIACNLPPPRTRPRRPTQN